MNNDDYTDEERKLMREVFKPRDVRVSPICQADSSTHNCTKVGSWIAHQKCKDLRVFWCEVRYILFVEDLQWGHDCPACGEPMHTHWTTEKVRMPNGL